jgi:hypothetical protein
MARNVNEETKAAYIQEFGLQDYEKYSVEQFEDKSWKCSILDRMSLYRAYLTIVALMTPSSIRNHGKAVHSQPSIFASGKFMLHIKAKKFFGLDWPLETTGLATKLRHNFSSGHSHPLAKFVKSMSINISDKFHLTMLSTPNSGFWDANSFIEFSLVQGYRTMGQTDKVRDVFRRYPAMMQIAKAMPYYAKSYMELNYYDMVVYDFVRPNHPAYLVKFRARPLTQGNPTPEDRYLMPRDEISKIGISDYFNHDDQLTDPDIFETDYKDRLSQVSNLVYRVEYQTRTMPVNDEQELRTARNIALEWNETECPWRLFGHVEIDTILPDVDNFFDPRVMFSGLSLPEPKSSYDTASIGWFRSKVYPTMQFLRGARSLSSCC